MSEPVELEPESVAALWGGDRLAPNVAEVWLASELAHRPTRVARGPLRGELPSMVLGYPLPVLAKFLDARLPLSVQVHPDDERARARGHARGKSEAWVVLHAEPGSRVYAGLREGRDQSDLTADRIEDALHWFEPMVGDIVNLPAGTVHALGGGVTVFEIQQSCDVTYRLHDWGRVDPISGRPRELHIDEANTCVTMLSPVRPLRGVGSLVTPYFELHVHRGPVTLGGDGRTRLLVAFGQASSGCIDVPAGRAVLVPTMVGECRLRPEPGGWLFECILP